MSVEHLAIALHHSKARGTTKLVLLGIANHAGDGGSWPSVTTLARYANADVRSVQRALTRLVSSGELRVHVQEGGTRETPDHHRPNRYDLVLSCPPWCDRSPQHRDSRRNAGPQLGINLGIDRVTPVSPGDASVTGGVTPVSPGGVTPVSPEPSLEPSLNPGVGVEPEVQDARAFNRWDPRPCLECLEPERPCRTKQAKLHPEDRHDYQPKAVAHAEG